MSNFLETRPSVGTAASSGSPPAIEVQDLVKTYPGDVRALRGLSFTVEPGTVFGLLGPNGAGKSSTVKILTTLSRPDSGTARVAGIDVVKRPDRVRRAIGCVAQRSGVDLEPRRCSWTSPPRAWTRRHAPTCGTRSPASPARRALPSC